MISGRIVLCLGLAALAAGTTSRSARARQDVTTTRQVDLTITQGTSRAAAASPDGQSIAIDLLGGIWILPARGGDAKRITPELLEARQPAWSPDSHSIAFQGYEDGAWHIYVIGLEGGEARAITSGAFDDREPAWSSDGSRIAFSSDRYGGITTIWTVEVSTGESRRISTHDGWMPAWLPGDRELMFVSADAGRGPLPASAYPREFADNASALGGGGTGENGKNNNGSKESTHLIDASGLIVIPRNAVRRDLDPGEPIPPRPRSLAPLGMTRHVSSSSACARTTMTMTVG